MRWSELSMTERNEVIKMAVAQGIRDIPFIKNLYEESVNRSRRFDDGGDTNPAMTGMMKSKLATAAHFGNPTARRMTNQDTRSYTWPGEYEYDNGIGEPKRGNVFVDSYDNLVTPHIQDMGKELTFIEDVWSPENDRRSFMQSLKFNNEEDARYFGEHYKDIAPMMNLYNDGGHKIHIKPENRGKFTALKERTGHSATWFKEHGTPAQRKMAIFALNSRHWKHEDGGWLESLATTASKKVMNYIKGAHDTGSYFSYDSSMEPYTGPAQDTYLLPRSLQEKEFLKRGYIKGKDKDYGLVKKAVGNRDLPVYQRNPDAISRDNLTVIGNVHGWDPWYGDSNTSLEHAGSYPTAVYIDGEGNFYQKGWDLNDYGGKTGSTIGILSDIVDRVGSPVVVTTGYQPVKDPQSEKFIQEITPMMAKKGLIPTEINGKIAWTLPEVTVTGKKKKKAFGGNLFPKGGLIIKGL